MDIQLKNRYYLMRHGESIANKEGLIVSSSKNAINGYGLTTKGADQVLNAALSTRLGNELIIISSDYKRAVETATIMRSVLGISKEITYEPLLRERDFGAWELTEHENYEKIWQQDLTNPEETIKHAETVQQVLDRGLKVIKSLEKTYDDEKILLVGHGDVLQILFAYHHNINPRFHRSLSSIANADIRSLTQLEGLDKELA